MGFSAALTMLRPPVGRTSIPLRFGSHLNA
jgi:hypothetical protein